MLIVADNGATIHADPATLQGRQAKVIAKKGSTVYVQPSPDSSGLGENAAQSDSAEQLSIEIRPHCERVIYFELTSQGWLLATPQKKTLFTEISYTIDGIAFSQAVRADFEIKPTLAATMVGAVAGGFLGALARLLVSDSRAGATDWFVSIFAAMVMALIAAIALSRKTGTQGFITVEDFFGGFVIGAMIGYWGSEYFESTLSGSVGDAAGGDAAARGASGGEG